MGVGRRKLAPLWALALTLAWAQHTGSVEHGHEYLDLLPVTQGPAGDRLRGVTILPPLRTAPVVRALNPAHNGRVCSTWGDFHYKTFDGDVFRFPGLCNYVLSAHCGAAYEDFNVQVRRGLESNVTTLARVTMKLDGMVIELTKSSIQVNGLPIQLPFSQSGVIIEHSSSHLKVVARLGLVFMWSQDDSLLLELDAKYSNQTCGLCGDFNGVPVFDEFLSHGVKLTPIEFGNLQKLHGPTEQCQDPAPVPPLTCSLGTGICEEILSSWPFRGCNALVDASSYVQACRQDLCLCEHAELTSCVCHTVAEYSRQCAHAGGRPLDWRGPDLCPQTCPLNMQYRECGSPCADTCSNPEHSQLCEDHCMAGCFCPEGTVLDDIGQTGCIPAPQCACVYNGATYAPGAVYSTDCANCTCSSGRWSCQEVPCPGTCSVLGGSHFSTFDERQYTVHGDCSYVLAKPCDSSAFTVLAELRRCGLTDSETCLKSLTLSLDGGHTVIVVKASGEVFVNQIYTQMPVSAANVTLFRPSTFFIIAQTNLGLQLDIQLVPMMQVFLRLAPELRGLTCGLCGNFNQNQADDFRTLSGVVEGTAAAFANTWKTQAACPNVKNSFRGPLLPQRGEREKYAQHWCSRLKDPHGPFAQCHAAVSPGTYHSNCMFDTCNCQKSEDCLCAALSSYVHACAAKGVLLRGWRDGVCAKPMATCPKSLTYQYHISSCQPTCRARSHEDVTCGIRFVPVDGCACPQGTFMDEAGKCVPASSCPCYHEGSVVPNGESLHERGAICTCTQGLLSCIGGHTPAPVCTPPMVYVDCRNATPGAAGAGCQKSCLTLDMECYSPRCEPGCVCPDGLVADGEGGCVAVEDCPCVHDEASYLPGQTVRVGCNTCTCKSRMWQCTREPCLATCTVYGDGHYITFDGRSYSFSGDCAYTLLQDHCGGNSTANGTFRVVTENVPCGTTGVTCSKDLKLFLGSYELKLSGGKVEVIQKGVGQEAPYSIRQMGIYLVVDTEVGLVLLWDRKTSIFLKLSPEFKGRVCGLCGNFDDNAVNDFTTRSQSVVGNALEFGNSWKFSPSCADAPAPRDACAANPHRKSWAQKQCSVLNSATFAACHAHVEPAKYYEACVGDACACDSGGDCECLCTAVAAYAQACHDVGVCVSWRTPDICPLFCDYYNREGRCEWHYQPCGPPCMRTCRNPSGRCLTDLPGLEGCYPKCPQEAPIFDEDRMQCVATCPTPPPPPPCRVQGKSYRPGEMVPSDRNCQSCVCSESGVQCTYDTEACVCTYDGRRFRPGDVIYHTTDGTGGCISARCSANGTIDRRVYPCSPTTPTPPTTFSFSTPPLVVSSTRPAHTCHSPAKSTVRPSTRSGAPSSTPGTTSGPPTSPPRPHQACGEDCWWSPWLDVSHPGRGIDSGDFDTLENLRAHGHQVCPTPKRVECRAEDAPEVPIQVLGQHVECSPARGLTCYNRKQASGLCYNYQIKVQCCFPRTCPTSGGQTQTTTPVPGTTTTTLSTSTPIPGTTTTTPSTSTPVPGTTTTTPSTSTPIPGTTTTTPSTSTPVPGTTTTTPSTSTPVPGTTTTTPSTSTPVPGTTTTTPSTSTPVPGTTTTTPSTSTPVPGTTTTTPSTSTPVPGTTTTTPSTSTPVPSTPTPVPRTTTTTPSTSTPVPGTTTTTPSTSTPVPGTTTTTPSTSTPVPGTTTTTPSTSTPVPGTTTTTPSTSTPVPGTTTTTPSTSTPVPGTTTTTPSTSTPVPSTPTPVPRTTTTTPSTSTPVPGTTTTTPSTSTPVPGTTTTTPSTSTPVPGTTTTTPSTSTPVPSTPTPVPRTTTTTPSTSTPVPGTTTTTPSTSTPVPGTTTTTPSTSTPVPGTTTTTPSTSTPVPGTTTTTPSTSTPVPGTTTTTPSTSTPVPGTTTTTPSTSTPVPGTTTTTPSTSTPVPGTTTTTPSTSTPVPSTPTPVPRTTTTTPSTSTPVPGTTTTTPSTSTPVPGTTTTTPSTSTPVPGTTTTTPSTSTPVPSTPTPVPRTTTTTPSTSTPVPGTTTTTPSTSTPVPGTTTTTPSTSTPVPGTTTTTPSTSTPVPSTPTPVPGTTTTTLSTSTPVPGTTTTTPSTSTPIPGTTTTTPSTSTPVPGTTTTTPSTSTPVPGTTTTTPSTPTPVPGTTTTTPSTSTPVPSTPTPVPRTTTTTPSTSTPVPGTTTTTPSTSTPVPGTTTTTPSTSTPVPGTTTTTPSTSTPVPGTTTTTPSTSTPVPGTTTTTPSTSTPVPGTTTTTPSTSTPVPGTTTTTPSTSTPVPGTTTTTPSTSTPVPGTTTTTPSTSTPVPGTTTTTPSTSTPVPGTTTTTPSTSTPIPGTTTTTPSTSTPIPGTTTTTPSTSTPVPGTTTTTPSTSTPVPGTTTTTPSTPTPVPRTTTTTPSTSTPVPSTPTPVPRTTTTTPSTSTPVPGTTTTTPSTSTPVPGTTTTTPSTSTPVPGTTTTTPSTSTPVPSTPTPVPGTTTTVKNTPLTPRPMPVSTTPEPCLQKLCNWTQWFDSSYPGPGINGGDFDTFHDLRAKGHKFCEKPSNVECRAQFFPNIPLEELGQDLICDKSLGLLCLNRNQLPPICYNYEIRIECCELVDVCRSTTHPVTSETTYSTREEPGTQTQLTWTTGIPSSPTRHSTASSVHAHPTTSITTGTHSVSPAVTIPCQPQCTWTKWFDVDFPSPGPHGGDTETFGNIVRREGKICRQPEYITRLECRAESHPEVSIETLGQVVECNVSKGLVCRNRDQGGDVGMCLNYEVRMLCCEPPEYCSTHKTVSVPHTSSVSTTRLTETTSHLVTSSSTSVPKTSSTSVTESSPTSVTETSSTSVTETSSTSVTETRPTSVTETSSTSVTETSPTSVTETRPTSVTETRPTSVTETSPTSVTETSPTSVTETSSTSVTETSQTSVTETSPTSVTETSSISVTETRPTSVTETSSTSVTETRPTLVTETSPTSVTKTRPTSVTETSPTSVTKTRPTSVTETSSTSVTKTRPTLVTETSPTSVTKTRPTSVTETSPTSVTETSPTSVTETSSTSVTETSPTSVTETSSTLVTETRPTSVTETRPTLVTKTRPTSVTETSSTSVTETRPTLVTETRPTSVTKTRPTSVTETSPTSVTKTRPTSVTETSSTSVTESSPTSVTETSSTSVTETSSTSVTETSSISVTETRPTSVTETSPTSVTETSPTSVTETRPTSVTETSSTSVTKTRPTSVTETSSTSVTKTRPTSVTETSPTSVTETSSTSVTETSSTSVTETSPTSVTETRPTSVTETRPTSVTETRPTSVTETSSTSVTESSPTSVTETSSTSVTETSSTSVTETSSISVTETRPTSVTETSPTSVTETSPTSVTETSPTSVTETSSTSVTKTRPTSVTETSSTSVTETSSTSVTETSSTSVTETSSTLVTETSPTSVTETSPTSVTETRPTSVTKTRPTSVTETSPTSVTETSSTSVTETSPTSVTETSSTSVTETSPTSVTETSPTSVTETSSTSVTETSPTSVTETSSTSVTETSPTSVTETSPTSVTKTRPTSVTETSPTSVTETSSTSVTETSPTSVTKTSPTSEPKRSTTSGPTMSTSPVLKTETTHFTPVTIPCQPQCRWTKWFDVDFPSPGPHGGDADTLGNIVRREGKICRRPEYITRLECRVESHPEVSIETLGQVVECNVSKGLVCRDRDQSGEVGMCNYEVRVLCCELPEHCLRTSGTPYATPSTKPSSPPEPTSVVSTTTCYCSVSDKVYRAGSVIYNRTDLDGHCYYATCSLDCHVVRTHYTCASGTTPPVPTTSPAGSSPSASAPVTAQGCPNAVPPRKKGETWAMPNCSQATCEGNGVITLQPRPCPQVQRPTCANGYPPVKVVDPDSCCPHYRCQCVCSGWGDPHYITFDGTYYTFLDNCTYVLVQQILPVYGHFRVLIDNYFCGAEDGLSCPQSIIVEYQQDRVVLTRKPVLGVMTNEIIFNDKVVKPGFQKDGVSVSQIGIKMYLTIPELGVQVMFSGLIFSVELPFSKFANNTEGQCGTCTNDKKDECRLPGGTVVPSCSDMSGHWKVTTPHQPPCHGPPPKPTAAGPTPSPAPCLPSPICQLILSEVFELCHPLIPPLAFYQGCTFDHCHLNDSNVLCSSLELYASLCASRGVCIDWRRHTNHTCSFTCPADKVYLPCGPSKPSYCYGSDNTSLVALQDTVPITEGCFCPENMTHFSMSSPVCVPADCHRCLGPHGEAVEPGHTISVDCQRCTCESSTLTMSCHRQPCPLPPACPLPGFVPVPAAPQAGQCCPQYNCACDTSYCPKPVACPEGSHPVVTYTEGACCPSQNCSWDVCSVNGTLYQPLCETCRCEVSSSPQLDTVVISCETQICNTHCPAGFEYQEQSGQCCGLCVQQACVVNASDSSTRIFYPGQSWPDPTNPCVTHECEKHRDGLVVVTRKKACPPLNCPAAQAQLSEDGCCLACPPPQPQNQSACAVYYKREVIVHGDCRSPRPMRVAYCQGNCGDSSAKYSPEANTIERNCSCCSELRVSPTTVTLRCKDGSSRTFGYTLVKECGCVGQQCGPRGNLSHSKESGPSRSDEERSPETGHTGWRRASGSPRSARPPPSGTQR
ncbi:von Willebrand factor isoform X1 [Prionailurus iriomotensis]